MKNTSAMILLFVTVAFAAFTSGVFFGRATVNPHSPDFTLHSTTECSGDPAIDSKLNINTASQDELVLLPGIGEVLAQRIVEHREKIGAFTSLDQLLDVSGIGASKLNAITKYLTVGG